MLVHGFTGTWHLWLPVLAPLAARFDVLAPTLAGHHGGPPVQLSGPFTLADGARWIEQELDQQGIDSAHLVGSSLGGALSLELAKRGRARSVLAISPGFEWLPGDPVGPAIAKKFRAQHARTHRSENRLERLMRSAVIRRYALRNSMRHGEQVPPEEAVAMARASLRCSIAEQILDAIESGNTALDGLNEVTAPTLVAWPEHDRVAPQGRHSKRFVAEIPDVTFRVLEGAGHLPMYDEPTAVAAMISDWVDHAVALRAVAST